MHNTTPNPTPSAQHTPRPTKCRPGPAAAAVTVETAAPPRNGPKRPETAPPRLQQPRRFRPLVGSTAPLAGAPPACRPNARGQPLGGSPVWDRRSVVRPVWCRGSEKRLVQGERRPGAPRNACSRGRLVDYNM